MHYIMMQEVISLKAITIRDLPAQIIHAIQQRALQRHTSINKAVISYLEEIILKKPKPKNQYHDLDYLAGSWNKPAAANFREKLSRQRRIDPELWQ